MSSGRNTPENSERSRILELEKQLDDEQCAHNRTKSVFHDAQEELQQTEIIIGDPNVKNPEIDGKQENLNESIEDLKKTVEDLRRENSRLLVSKNENENFMEKLKLENGDLKNALHVKEELFEEQGKKTGELGKTIIVLTIKSEDLQQSISSFVFAQKYCEPAKIEKKKLEEEIEAMKQLLKEQSEKQLELKSMNEDLHKEYLKLKKCNEENLKKLAIRLEEYREEVKRLRDTKMIIARCCESLSRNYYEFVGSSMSSLKEQNSTENAKELKQLEGDEKKMRDEWDWWQQYDWLNFDITKAFDAIQEMNENSGSVVSIEEGRQALTFKEHFDRESDYFKERIEGKEWVRVEISTGGKYFEKLEQLVEEATKRLNIEEDQL